MGLSPSLGSGPVSLTGNWVCLPHLEMGLSPSLGSGSVSLTGKWVCLPHWEVGLSPSLGSGPVSLTGKWVCLPLWEVGLSPSRGSGSVSPTRKWDQGLTWVIYSHLVDPSIFLLNVLEELSHSGADGAECEETLNVDVARKRRSGGQGHRHHGQTILIPQAQLYNTRHSSGDVIWQ